MTKGLNLAKLFVKFGQEIFETTQMPMFAAYLSSSGHFLVVLKTRMEVSDFCHVGLGWI